MISNIFLNPSPYAIGNYATWPKFHGRHIHNINTRPYHVHVFFWKRDDGWNSCPQRCSQKAKHCPLNQLHRSSDRKKTFSKMLLKCRLASIVQEQLIQTQDPRPDKSNKVFLFLFREFKISISHLFLTLSETLTGLVTSTTFRFSWTLSQNQMFAVYCYTGVWSSCDLRGVKWAGQRRVFTYHVLQTIL